jgi:hypothetical protein
MQRTAKLFGFSLILLLAAASVAGAAEADSARYRRCLADSNANPAAARPMRKIG